MGEAGRAAGTRRWTEDRDWAFAYRAGVWPAVSREALVLVLAEVGAA
ncbi:hypothetical protein [Actinoplanes missouriensis]|nr:hypothetical protein [Actinoplanes missouriensis]